MPVGGGIYDHSYVVISNGASFSGTGPGNADSGPETVSGTYDGSTLTFTAVYGRPDGYQYTVANGVVTGNSYSGLAVASDGGKTNVTGTLLF